MSTYRDTSRGDTNDLILQIRDLSKQLEGRKQANVKLSTENARLQRQLYDLQQRLADIETGRATKRGEAASLLALRQRAANTKSQSQDTANNLQEAMDQNQQLVDAVNKVQQDLQVMQAQLDGSLKRESEYEQEMAQKDVLVQQLTETKSALELTLNETQKANDELEKAREGLMKENARLVQQLSDVQKSHESTLAAVQQDAAAAREAQRTQLMVEHDGALRQETSAALSKHEQLMELQAKVQQATQPLPSLPSTWKTLEGPLLPSRDPKSTSSIVGTDEALLNCVEVLLHTCAGTASTPLWPCLLLEHPGLGCEFVMLTPNSDRMMLESALFPTKKEGAVSYHNQVAVAAADTAGGRGSDRPLDMLSSDAVPQARVQDSFALDPNGHQGAAATVNGDQGAAATVNGDQGAAATVSGTPPNELPAALQNGTGAAEAVITGREAEAAAETGIVSAGHPTLPYTCDINKMVMLHFSHKDSLALGLLSGSKTGTSQPKSADPLSSAGGSLCITLLNLQAGLLGGMVLPGTGPGTGDMTAVQQLLVVFTQHRPLFLSHPNLASTPQQEQLVIGGAPDPVVDGDILERVVAVCVELFCVEGPSSGSTLPDAAVCPTSHAMTLSTDWRGVKPPGTPSPGPQEFVVDMQSFHPLQLEAARSSGLFDAAGCTFEGTDGRLYQVWGIQSHKLREQATSKRSMWKGLPLALDGFNPARTTIGAAMLPLSQALRAPSASKVHATRSQAILQGQPPSSFPEPYPTDPGTSAQQLPLLRATVATADHSLQDSHAEAVITVNVRLRQDLMLSDALLPGLSGGTQAGASFNPTPVIAAFQPVMHSQEVPLPMVTGQASEKAEPVVVEEGAVGSALTAVPEVTLRDDQAVATASFPQGDQRWSVEMVARQVKVAGLLARLQQVVEGGWRDICRTAACSEEAAQPASLQNLASSSKEVMQSCLKEIHGELKGCSVIAASVKSPPEEQNLAEDMAAMTRGQVFRCLQQLIQRTYHLVQITILSHQLWLWYQGQSPTAAATSSLPAQSTPQLYPCVPVPGEQHQHLLSYMAEVLETAISDMGLTASQPSPSHTAPLPSLQATTLSMAVAVQVDVEQGCTAAITAAKTTRTSLSADTAAITAAETTRTSLSADTAAITAAETTRTSLSADTAAITAAETNRTSLSADKNTQGSTQQVSEEAMSAALVAATCSGLAPVSGTLALGLAAVCKVAASAAAGGPASGTLARHPAIVALAQLGLMQTNTSSVAAGFGAPPGTTPSSQLLMVVSQLQPVFGKLPVKAEPIATAPSPQAAATWLVSSSRQRCLIGACCALWTALLAAYTSHTALLMSGGRYQGLVAVVNALAPELERAVSQVQALLTGIKISIQAYSDDILATALPKVAQVLSQHITGLIGLTYGILLQQLLLPITVIPSSTYVPGATPSTYVPGATPSAAWQASGLNSWQGCELTVATCSLQQLQQAASQVLEPADAASASRLPAPLPASPVVLGSLSNALSSKIQPLAAGWAPMQAVLLLDTQKYSGVSSHSDPSVNAAQSALPDAVERAAGLLNWRLIRAEQLIGGGPFDAGSPAWMEALKQGAPHADLCVLIGSSPELMSAAKIQGLPVAQDKDFQQPSDPRAVAKQLVARVVLHVLHARAAALNQRRPALQTPPPSAPVSRRPSSSGAPLSAAGLPPAGISGASRLVSTFVDEGIDAAGRQQLLQSTRDLSSRLTSALSNLKAPLQPSQQLLTAAGAVSAACLPVLEQQQLLLEGALSAIDVMAAMQEASKRVALPAMRSRQMNGAGATLTPLRSPAPGVASPALEAALQAQAANLMQQEPGGKQQQGLESRGQGAGPPQSTESEDEEAHVIPLSAVKLPTGADDVESDAASVRSASTIEGGLPSMRRR
ncbi:hypothetical protein CEUSTIGMA_g1496.t1 [Chlamydomonas eustigma]|uniref:Uncharacterized protein n=1 Tax=Chlamydomonas eustigma TaxID=1157962 RepID=A0A250WTG8_9CHLO|nr:hypothetical protein CEUSTIGMA_g1496.t1 [Chlamydomonas eustigma]|eukprot:GAX74046.1 hypothetical protein CEUSTIGMA_g1496.t1 [Chlamydomonas eustigma]